MTAWARAAAFVGAPALAVAVFAAVQWLGSGREGADPADAGDVGRVALRDVLITRDSQMLEGRLEGCTPSGCRLDGQSYARETIAFVGLGTESALPPVVEDPGHDELHLRDGSRVHEPLVQIDGDHVNAGARSFDRAQVEWVYLAAARGEAPPAFGAPGADRPAEATPPETSPTPPPPRRPRAAFEGCPDDRPLGAWIWLRNDYQDGSPPSCRGAETQVLRFRLEADPGTTLPGAVAAGAYHAKELRYSVTTDGCFAVPDRNSYETCNAEGTFVEGTLPITTENLGFAAFFPLGPELSFQYPTPPDFPFELTVRCVDPATGLSEDSATTATGFKGISIGPGDCENANRWCSSYCVAPTECEASDAQSDCFLHPDRYAVIPFEGALVDGPERELRGGCTDAGSSQVRWRVCCGCAETGPPPEFTPRRDPCGPPEPQRALLDTALEQQRAILRPLGELLREQQRIQAQAAQWRGDFEQASRDCGLWSAARTLVGLLASGGAPGVGTGVLRGAEPVPAAKEFWNFLAMAEKLNAGDPSWLLPNHEFNDWASVEDAWDAFTIAHGALGPSSPASLRAGLAQCGAPTSEGVLDGAYAYLGQLEQLPALGEQVSRVLNDSRAKDQEIFDLWQKWQQACRDFERCSGGDPRRCDAAPGSAVSQGGAS